MPGWHGAGSVRAGGGGTVSPSADVTMAAGWQSLAWCWQHTGTAHPGCLGLRGRCESDLRGPSTFALGSPVRPCWAQGCRSRVRSLPGQDQPTGVSTWRQWWQHRGLLTDSSGTRYRLMWPCHSPSSTPRPDPSRVLPCIKRAVTPAGSRTQHLRPQVRLTLTHHPAAARSTIALHRTATVRPGDHPSHPHPLLPDAPCQDSWGPRCSACTAQCHGAQPHA